MFSYRHLYLDDVVLDEDSITGMADSRDALRATFQGLLAELEEIGVDSPAILIESKTRTAVFLHHGSQIASGITKDPANHWPGPFGVDFQQDCQCCAGCPKTGNPKSLMIFEIFAHWRRE